MNTSLTSFYLVKLMHLCDGRAKIGPARKPLSDFMEHDCPSALIMSAVVHVAHCPSGILGHGHSAFSYNLYSRQTFFAL